MMSKNETQSPFGTVLKKYYNPIFQDTEKWVKLTKESLKMTDEELKKNVFKNIKKLKEVENGRN